MNNHFKTDAAPITLYRNPLSGHCHKVELMLNLLDLPCTTVDLNMTEAEHKSPPFLSKNSFGQVPVIDDNGIIVSDSNAILVYLVSQYPSDYEWMPTQAILAAGVQRWLSVAAGQIAYGPASARLVTVFGASLDHELAKQRAKQLFQTMDKHLTAQAFLVGEQITIADIACYSYIAHAPEGGANLDEFTHIQNWLNRIEALPRFIAMEKTPLVADESAIA